MKKPSRKKAHNDSLPITFDSPCEVVPFAFPSPPSLEWEKPPKKAEIQHAKALADEYAFLRSLMPHAKEELPTETGEVATAKAALIHRARELLPLAAQKCQQYEATFHQAVNETLDGLNRGSVDRFFWFLALIGPRLLTDTHILNHVEQWWLGASTSAVLQERVYRIGKTLALHGGRMRAVDQDEKREKHSQSSAVSKGIARWVRKYEKYAALWRDVEQARKQTLMEFDESDRIKGPKPKPGIWITLTPHTRWRTYRNEACLFVDPETAKSLTGTNTGNGRAAARYLTSEEILVQERRQAQSRKARIRRDLVTALEEARRVIKTLP